MRVKKYVVESMPDAMQKIRSELGKDAVIINTKEIKQGGFLGLFSKKKIEVIAAIDQSEKSQAAVSSAMHSDRGIAARGIGTETVSTSQAPASIAVLQERLSAALDQSNVKPPEQPLLNRKHDASNEEQQLMVEMKQMKEMMRKLVSNQYQQGGQIEAIDKLEQKLLNHEFEPHLIEEIKQTIIHHFEKEQIEFTDDRVLDEAQRYLKQMITSVDRKGIDGKTQIVHFVGPTGVGKTTTIAKLAAEQVLKHKRKVGFITSDTYRIAAIEQLKTYGNILNVPLEVVFSPQELTKAFDQLKDQELIFMDTAGRNYRNEMYVSELNSLLNSNHTSETYLVLSMTMKYKDMKAITDNFAKFKIDKVLFTKLDETDSYGPIFNLIHDFSLPLSYVTNGQNVPDDIEPFDEDAWIKHILEG